MQGTLVGTRCRLTRCASRATTRVRSQQHAMLADAVCGRPPTLWRHRDEVEEAEKHGRVADDNFNKNYVRLPTNPLREVMSAFQP